MNRIHALVLVACLPALRAAAEVSCPPSAMGKLACAAVQQLNQPSIPALKAWAAAAMSSQAAPADRVELERTLLAVAAESGGVDLVAARDGRTPGVAVVTLRARRSGARMLLALFPAPGEPAKVGRFDAFPLPDPELFSAFPSTKRTEEQVSAAVVAQLRKLVAARDFSGCVRVFNGARTIVDECAGLAERSFGAPVARDTKFHLGSMDKMFTAVAIAQLVEAGKLSWDAPLGKLVPALAASGAAKSTVWQLLHHTSGLGDFFVPEFFEHREKFVDPADYVDLISRQPLAGAPGAFSYSNAGFVLLGRIVELASGEGYFHYLQRHVFGPAGMTASGFDAVEEVTPKLAVGYLRDDPFGSGPWKANWMTLPFKGSPAGGGYSTTADLIAFSIALRGGKLLGAPALQKLFEDEAVMMPGHNYAAGFEDRLAGARHLRGHNGGAPGMNAALEIVWETGYAVAVTSNEDGTAAQDFADHIAELVALN